MKAGTTLVFMAMIVAGMANVTFGYYNQSLGRWTSEDPLGIDPGTVRVGIEVDFFVHEQYVDSRNIYEYGIGNPVLLLDPWGQATMRECQDGISDALSSQEGRNLMADLVKKKGRCKKPNFSCQCCQGSAGAFSPATKDITFCINRIGGRPQVKDAAIHELIHAWDDCKGTDWSECEERACSEIRAYAQSEMCYQGHGWRKKGESWGNCVKRSARKSTEADPKCKKESGLLIQRLFVQCAGKSSPMR